MTTGQRIKNARKNANMTQAELAQKLEIPFQSVSQWERDIRRPKKETLANIAKALDVDPLELSDDDFDKELLAAIQRAFGSDEDFRTAFLSDRVSLAILRTDEDVRLMQFYDMLNEHGRECALDYVFELSQQSEYLKDIYTKSPEELRKLQEDSKPLPYPPIEKPPQD